MPTYGLILETLGRGWWSLEVNHLSQKLKCCHINNSHHIHKAFAGYETLIESIKYMNIEDNILLYLCILTQTPHCGGEQAITRQS